MVRFILTVKIEGILLPGSGPVSRNLARALLPTPQEPLQQKLFGEKCKTFSVRGFGLAGGNGAPLERL